MKYTSIRNYNYSNKIQTKEGYNKKRETFEENKKKITVRKEEKLL